MCIIIDTNVVHLLLDQTNQDLTPVRESLDKGEICLYYGGKLLTEYYNVTEMRRWIITLDKAGKAKQSNMSDYSRELNTVSNIGHVSDDEHILALARVFNARLLCTNDNALMVDFKDKKIIPQRGKIYKKASHKNLIKKYSKQCYT
jgi:predicted nucleic acid-binding protein